MKNYKIIDLKLQMICNFMKLVKKTRENWMKQSAVIFK